MPPSKRIKAKRLAKEIEAFLKALPSGSDPKAVSLLRELRDALYERHYGGLQWAQERDLISYSVLKRLLE